MKSLVFALSLVSALSAHAVTLHTCILKTQSKGTPGALGHSQQTVYVANATGNLVRASENTLLLFSLPMVGSEADVWVNGQMQFIFKGNVAQGSFESASDTGTIRCDAGQEVGAIYSASGVTSPAKSGSMLASCYIGSSKAVANDLQTVEGFKANAISINAQTGAVTATRAESQCISGHGTNPDDYVCNKRGVVNARYTLPNCDYKQDPR